MKQTLSSEPGLHLGNERKREDPSSTVHEERRRMKSSRMLEAIGMCIVAVGLIVTIGPASDSTRDDVVFYCRVAMVLLAASLITYFVGLSRSLAQEKHLNQKPDTVDDEDG